MKDQDNSFKYYSVGLIRVLMNTPKFLRLYFALLTDNRVASKAKVGIVTAVAALGAYVVFGTVLYNIQLLLNTLVDGCGMHSQARSAWHKPLEQGQVVYGHRGRRPLRSIRPTSPTAMSDWSSMK